MTESILKKKKIQTVEDLLFDFPIKYEDYTIHSIHDAISVSYTHLTLPTNREV